MKLDDQDKKLIRWCIVIGGITLAFLLIIWGLLELL